ncbi:hypothetical protein HOD08_03455 [bacterium]|nr:hypothetical protein [bacterium]
MKKIESLQDFIMHVQDLHKDIFKRYLIIVIVIGASMMLAGVAYIKITSSLYVSQIRETAKLSSKVEQLIGEHEQIEQEEVEMTELLESGTFRNLKSYFEQFIKKNSISPETNWAETSEMHTSDENDALEEERIAAKFSNKNTKQIVEIIGFVESDKILRIKDATIINTGGKLVLTLTIAAQRLKRKTDEA